MPFTTLTAEMGHLTRKLAEAAQEIKRLEKIVRIKDEHISRLEEKITELEAELSTKQTWPTTTPIDSPYLQPLIECLCTNALRDPCGRRYKMMRDFFALLSFMGPHHFNILHNQLLFPSYRTALEYRNQILAENEISDFIFEGGRDNFERILSLMLPNGYQGRMILMIDAAYVTPYVKVYESGKVTGLLNKSQIAPDDAQEIIHNPKKFTKFLYSNQHNLIKAEFGLMLAPLDTSLSPIPIACISATSGTGTLKQIENLETIIYILKDLKVDIAGLATDGDHLYGRYSEAFVNKLVSDIPGLCDLTVVEFIAKCDMLFHFSDPYHLAKRDRYRKISKPWFTAVPNSIGQQLSATVLENLGIPNYLLDGERARKMEDALPLKLFSRENLEKVIGHKNYELAFCMLPTTLLMESLHSEGLSREQRINLLLFGSSLVLIYYVTFFNFTDKPSKTRAEAVRDVRSHSAFTLTWCREYISVTIGIANLLATEENIHLGACGTHFLEHFFGAIRRHSAGEDTHQRFLGSMRNVLLERLLLQKLDIPLDPPSRRSDSGVRITQGEFAQIYPFGVYLQWAKLFMNNFTKFPKHLGLDFIASNQEKAGFELIEELLNPSKIFISFQISTKSEEITSTGGLSNTRRWKARTQLDRFFHMSPLLDETREN